jgi:hypothetical protein
MMNIRKPEIQQTGEAVIGANSGKIMKLQIDDSGMKYSGKT